MRTGLKEGETIIKKGLASLCVKKQYIGGTLYLTSQRLIFEPRRFYRRFRPVEVDLSNVRSAGKCRTIYFFPFISFPNSLLLNMSEGKELRFVVFGRKGWERLINSMISPNTHAL